MTVSKTVEVTPIIQLINEVIKMGVDLVHDDIRDVGKLFCNDPKCPYPKPHFHHIWLGAGMAVGGAAVKYYLWYRSR